MTFRHVLLKIGLILITIITFSTAKRHVDTEINYNLYAHSHPGDYSLLPSHYDVKLTFDFNEYVFFGESNITFNINTKKDFLTISCIIFGILDIYLINSHNNQSINILNYVFINKTLYLDFIKSNGLLPGTYILKMIYVGTIFDDRNFSGYLYGDKV